MPLTDYERGKLTLQAFGLLDGWGINEADGKFKPWTLDRRKEEARKMADWAAASEEPAEK